MPVRDTPWAPGTPCWIDLMTTDQAAAREFYAQLFGWQIEVGPEETGGYAMASIDAHAVAGIGGMNGMDHPPVWSTYLATADADATGAAVASAGGSVVTPVMDVLDFGRMGFAQLPGGGVFGYWQAGTHLGCALTNEDNTLIWNEFLGRDYAAAKRFYAEVFGYTYTEMGDESFPYASAEIEGAAVAGIGTLPDGVPSGVPPHWRVYFSVADCDAAAGRVAELGGSIRREPTDMPYGRYADVADPQGAMFSVITPPK